MTPDQNALEIEMERDFFKDAANDAPTKPLFLYTGAAGFQGIIETGHLWATHFDHLNDRGELRAAKTLVVEEANRLLHELPAGTPRRDMVEYFLALRSVAPVRDGLA